MFFGSHALNMMWPILSWSVLLYIGCSLLPCLYVIQWNLDLSSPQRSFYRIYCASSLVANKFPHKQRYLFPHPSFSQTCFSAFIACKSRSRHSISHMDFLAWFVWEKKLKWAINVGSVLHTSTTCGRLYVCIQSTHIYLCYIIFASHVTFSFESSILALFSSLTVALWKKRVRTLHDRLKIIQEVEQNPGEKRVDIAKRLGLPASTLNSIFAKKNEIREQIQKCVTRARREKLARSRHLLNWKWCSSPGISTV
jgi:hypothetical protein